MEVIDEETVFFDRFPFGVAPHEFLVESVSLCGFVIGRSDIFDSYRFGTVHMAYPVGIGQIDTDGGRGIAIAGENGSRDDFGRYAFDLFFLECGIGRGVVFEPLGIGADDFGAVGGVEVFEVYDRFPTASPYTSMNPFTKSIRESRSVTHCIEYSSNVFKSPVR